MFVGSLSNLETRNRPGFIEVFRVFPRVGGAGSSGLVGPIFGGTREGADLFIGIYIAYI